MTIKYNVSGAKARNGKEILPMAFGDRAEAERFAKYHEGLSVPQNLRKHPGNITVVGTGSMEYPQLQNIPKSSESATAQAVLSALIKSGDEFVMHYPNCQMIGRVHRRNFEEGGVERKSPPVTIVVDPKVFMAGVEEHTGPVQVLKLPKENVHELTDPLDKVLTDKAAARLLTYDPSKAVSLADMQARYAQPLERTAAVGNADLESAYEMGFRLGMSAHYDSVRPDAAIETQDYVDQRRSDLKELVSYDRSI